MKLKKRLKKVKAKIFWCTNSNGKEYNFYKFANLDLFEKKTFNGKTSIEDTLEKQSEMKKLSMSLKEHNPSNDYKKKCKERVLENAEDLLETRNKIINAFRDSIFPLAKNVQEQTKEAKIDWIHRPISELKDLKDKLDTYNKLSTTDDDKKIEIKVIKKILNGILSGRNNKDNVKNKYLEHIYDVKKLLDETIVKKIQELNQN